MRSRRSDLGSRACSQRYSARQVECVAVAAHSLSSTVIINGPMRGLCARRIVAYYDIGIVMERPRCSRSACCSPCCSIPLPPRSRSRNVRRRFRSKALLRPVRCRSFLPTTGGTPTSRRHRLIRTRPISSRSSTTAAHGDCTRISAVKHHRAVSTFTACRTRSSTAINRNRR